jgi:hypothetical protein
MIAYTRENAHHTSVHVDFRFVWGAYVDVMRNKSASLAIKGQYDFLMMLDADMIYPEHTIVQSVNHDKDVVCGLYYWKTLKPFKNKAGAGYAAHVYKEYDENIFQDYPQWVSLDVAKQEKDLIEVDGLGGGGLCIKRKVLEKLGAPQFECTWDSTEISGEDLNFCKKAKKEGFRIFCDISLNFGHLTQSVVHNGKLTDLQQYASQNRKSFPGMGEDEVVIKRKPVSKRDLTTIEDTIAKKRFAGKIKQVNNGGKENAKIKNSKVKL